MSFIIQSGYQKSAEGEPGNTNFDYWREVVCDEFVQLACDPQVDQDLSGFGARLRGGVGVTDVSFSEVISAPQIVTRTQRQVSRAQQDEFLISFQLENNCTLRQFGREATLTPGSFALYDSTSPYSLSFDDAFHQFVIKMPREVLARHLIEPEKFAAVAIDSSAGLGLVLRDFIFSLARELSNTEAQPSELLSENLVSLIAMSFSSTVSQSGLAESDDIREALKRRIKQFIENNLFDPTLNNQKIAASQGISLRYLHKLFQDEDESAHEMVLNKRLATAHELLLAGSDSLTIESVAYHVGFSGASHFSRAFKAHYGISPSSV